MGNARRGVIDVVVTECGEDCPFYRRNECADDGVTFSCEKNYNVDLNTYFKPARYFVSQPIKAFPDACPLAEVEQP